ncbi:MAG TPA: hypothetical protein PKN27_05495 [Propionibacteriaceae bacterium]|nr:hypothetical protein [Propionibacteriaceae bacterium]
MTTYVLKPRPPLRAFVLAAGLSVAGAVLIALAASGGWGTLWVVIFALVLALGVAFGAAGAVSMRTMRVFVDVTDEGWAVRGAGQHKHGPWADVTKVTTSDHGAHISLHHGQVARTHLFCASGGEDPQMQALIADIAAHLDADRGYGTIEI